MTDEPRADDRVLEARGVIKNYGDNAVLRGVGLSVRPGEVVALAGENGAGKSTLMKIIAGLVVPDDGTVDVEGTALHLGSARDARRLGVAIVPQELAPVPDLSVAANIFLGREPQHLLGLVNRAELHRRAAELLESFGLAIDPRTPMRRLSTATQQLVEIIKSTSIGARLLLLDEPTSAIAQQEVDRLVAMIERLRSRGVAVIFTTHKMAEIRALATRVVILRDGDLITDRRADEITDEQIVTAMIGRELQDLYPSNPRTSADEPLLRVDDLLVERGAAPISLEVRPGEIVALAGLMGAGRTELLETIFGARRSFGGRCLVDGEPIRPHSTVSAIEAGIALVPEDRKVGGAVLSMSILFNSVLPRLSSFTRLGWLRRRWAARQVTTMMDAVNLKRASLAQEVAHLSGGNQQKVVIGRWLAGDVRVLLLDEPTRGVDVGARSEIYRLIVQFAHDEGIAVLMASSDMPEVIGLAHRIIVMRQGQVVAELDRSDYADAEELQEIVFRHAAGIELAEKEDA